MERKPLTGLNTKNFNYYVDNRQAIIDDANGHTSIPAKEPGMVLVDTPEGRLYQPATVLEEAGEMSLPWITGTRSNKVLMPKGPAGIDETLGERGKRYGEFKDQAVYAQGMAGIAHTSPNWATMAPDQREALSIIFNKIGRILNGDPDYSDSWHDIAGYATLVDKRLKVEGK